jgi:uncharacterized protein
MNSCTLCISMEHIISIILFALAAISLLFASHFFVYWSLGHFFQIVNPGINTALAVVIIIFALSFVLSSLLAHWRENVFTRLYYYASGIWLGFLTNLLVTLIFAWAIVALGDVLRIHLNQGLLGTLAIVSAIVYTVWGVFNARNPRIKEITVKIENLPDAWRSRTAVHVSDIHLGHVHNSRFLGQVVDKINLQKPSIVFITGDLFDGMDGKLDAHIEPLDRIQAEWGTYFITGNHETYFGVAKAESLLAKTKVKILSDESVDVQGMKVVGLNYAEQWENRDLARVIREEIKLRPEDPSILLYHSPDQIEDIKETGINLQLAGHTHRGQMFPFNYITKLIFKGYDYGLHVDGAYSLYTTSGVGTWGPAMRTGNKPEIVVIKFE